MGFKEGDCPGAFLNVEFLVDRFGCDCKGKLVLESSHFDVQQIHVTMTIACRVEDRHVEVYGHMSSAARRRDSTSEMICNLTFHAYKQESENRQTCYFVRDY